jgi:hypothetical protein
MHTPDIPAALAAAQADLENAQQRIAELQAALAKPKPFVRALEAIEDEDGDIRLYFPGEIDKYCAFTLYRCDCNRHSIPPAEFANAVRLAMCMRDWFITDRPSYQQVPLAHWLRCELTGDTIDTEKYRSGKSHAAFVGWLS